MAELGSDAWLKADDFDEDDDLHIRATAFFEAIKWDHVISIASKLKGADCEFSEKYSIGYYNLVRRLTFTDGTSWIVRLRLPPLSTVFGTREVMKGTDCMAIEVATMNYLKLNTNLPIPEVFGHDLSSDNAVGAPYMFMSYIHGTVANDLQSARGCDLGMFGTPEQNDRFWRQMAEHHVHLASITFDKIGSLHQDGDKFFIGPEIETGQGPWVTPEEYYTALISHRMVVAENDAEPEVKDSKNFSFPSRLKESMHRFQTPGLTRFGLANRDFGAHNVLVDDEFNIVGFIDFDGVMAAPPATVAQLPIFTDVWRPIPGHVETRELAVARMEKTAHLLPQYVELIRSAVAKHELESGNGDANRLADDIVSGPASLVQGLDEFGQHCEPINGRWSTAYDLLLQS